MAPDRIIRYDRDFMTAFDKLKDLIEDGDKPVLHRFLIDNFGFVLDTFRYYAKHIAEGNADDFECIDEETKKELMRPLSHRQYRMIERAFSILKEEEDLVIWSVWDFLDDEGRIHQKKVMSSAEVSGFSLILEEVYRCLAR